MMFLFISPTYTPRHATFGRATEERYLTGKSAVLQDLLAASDLTAEEKRQIYALNTSM